MLFAMCTFGQQTAEKPKVFEASQVAKTFFFDADGNSISNNEFVDIRMANYNDKDTSKRKVFDDGTVEFRLQRVPQEGTQVPPVPFSTIGGRTFSPEQLRGKVVVLNFWFIGCAACMTEIPRLNLLAQKFRSNDNVIFIAVTADARQAVRNFLSRERFEYEMVADGQALIDRFAFAGYPKNIVVGRDGKIAYWRSTVHAWDKFESVLKAEIDKK
jgi:thiol-disulfide isomerase/thioredoxin